MHDTAPANGRRAFLARTVAVSSATLLSSWTVGTSRGGDPRQAWGLNRRAARLFRYWLATFVKGDGTLRYYGPSISEYGQLLHTAAVLDERAGPEGWWNDGFPALDRIASLLLRLREGALKDAGSAGGDRTAPAASGLIAGVPEADTRKDTARYFHNNAWVVRGLRRWAGVCERRGAAPATAAAAVRTAADGLAAATLRAIEAAWPSDPSDWWLPPQVEPLKRPARLTGAWDYASYTNYRYWPELLSSGLLPAPMANRIVQARRTAGGQFCGMTRFAGHLDDWPLADHLYGLWSLGRRDDFLLSLYGHIAYHQAEGHLTAYEQVSFPPGTKKADYCLPCQCARPRWNAALQNEDSGRTRESSWMAAFHRGRVHAGSSLARVATPVGKARTGACHAG